MPVPTHEQMTALRHIHTPRIRTNEDREIERHAASLIKYAHKLGADTDWTRTAEGMTITVRAPRPFIWAQTSEKELSYETSELSASAVQGAVIALVERMDSGLVKVQPEDDSDGECTGEDTCECEECEKYDDELCGELDFG